MTLGFQQARHLLSRTTFGARRREIDRFAKMRRGAAVDALLDSYARRPGLAPPAWVTAPPPGPSEREGKRKALRKQARERTQELKGWWWRTMVQTPSPWTERLTLFWHGHFPSESRKVKWAPLLFAQNQLLRAHAQGGFAQLLRGIARDPAMILYLDNQSNDRRTPNENFARELLELFTLGEGHYSERDIKEAARAFTGWRIRRSTGTFHFARHRHDGGRKTFMGRSGHLTGEDILETVLANPRLAHHLAERFWLAFVSSEVDSDAVASIARRFLDSGLSIRSLARATFLHDAFADRVGSPLIKSPADLIVGTLRVTQTESPRGRRLLRFGRRLGQDLFDPPNVKGWPGHTAWIDTASLLARHDFLARYAEEAAEIDDETLLTLPVTHSANTGADRILDPSYQLK
jgi:uncharacterized protein (DUF1800 family)